jgi:hypothetical protein
MTEIREDPDMLDAELADTLEEERRKHRRDYDQRLAKLGRKRTRPVNDRLHMPRREES